MPRIRRIEIHLEDSRKIILYFSFGRLEIAERLDAPKDGRTFSTMLEPKDIALVGHKPTREFLAKAVFDQKP